MTRISFTLDGPDGMVQIKRQNIEDAMLEVEKINHDLANLLRNYIRSLESLVIEMQQGGSADGQSEIDNS